LEVICSLEHDNIFSAFVGAFTAKSEREISAAGIEFVDAAHQTMIFLFQGTGSNCFYSQEP
jgi:hypothetical protein